MFSIHDVKLVVYMLTVQRLRIQAGRKRALTKSRKTPARTSHERGKCTLRLEAQKVQTVSTEHCGETVKTFYKYMRLIKHR